MDRLRAMEYMVRVVEAGSFAAAARELDVSPSAVTQLIGALERHLGVQLLRRHSRHLSLTPDGELFLPACASALAELGAAKARLSVNSSRASGKLIVGVGRTLTPPIAPFLPDFLARHPGITLDLRVVRSPNASAAALVDVLVFTGWLKDTDLVAKAIAQNRFVTCAAPAYWQASGRPRDPDELRRHACLAYRSQWGAVLDVWRYRRGNDVRNVALEARMVSEDLNLMITAAVQGAGVIRVTDLLNRRFFEQGLLEPVFTDWEALEAPPIHVLYRRGARQSARVRAFVEFVTGIFADLEASRASTGRITSVPMPPWYRNLWVGPLSRRIRARAEPAGSEAGS
ncbi:MAG TPA: LysR family transcriptional regulator [Burkholderiales bacterium]|nr:LysR family transcriptional regulator [Burkholderiales bacterium]